MFALGVLSIPESLAVLGALPGALNILGWMALNTYSGALLGNFRARHAGCHSVADMAQIVGGPWLRELMGALFIVTWTVLGAGGLVGISTALNALSLHAICTNWFTFVATVITILLASVRKFEHIGWLTYVGFVAIYSAVLIVV